MIDKDRDKDEERRGDCRAIMRVTHVKSPGKSRKHPLWAWLLSAFFGLRERRRERITIQSPTRFLPTLSEVGIAVLVSPETSLIRAHSRRECGWISPMPHTVTPAIWPVITRWPPRPQSRRDWATKNIRIRK